MFVRSEFAGAYPHLSVFLFTGVLALSSLAHVMKSLTPNARGIFLLLAKHQLNNKDNPAYPGAYPVCCSSCHPLQCVPYPVFQGINERKTVRARAYRQI